MLIQSCFIRKNTPELRKKLLKLGHTLCRCTEFEDADWLSVSNDKDLYRSVHGLGYTDETINIPKEDLFNNFLSNTNHIDCGENEELFLALVALRDDSDYMQWFICDDNESMFKVKKPNMTMEEFVHNYMDAWNVTGARKATVEELIEHFK
jgi:hypothetical protein